MTTNKTIEKILKEFDEKFAPEWNYRHVVNADTIKNFLKHSTEQAVKEKEEEIIDWLDKRYEIVKKEKPDNTNHADYLAGRADEIDDIINSLNK